MRLLQCFCFLIILIHEIFGRDVIRGRNDQYIIEKKVLGKGNFGEVRQGHAKKTGEVVAIKFGKVDKSLDLIAEILCYDDLGIHLGIPKIYYYGIYKRKEVIVMEFLGPSLQDLLEMSANGYFSIRTVGLLGIQMITRVEYIHSCGWIVADIKPDNFAMGAAPNFHNVVFAFDYGLSRKYLEKGVHVELGKEVICGVGSLRYISIISHKHLPFRRDDMEAIAHVLIYLSEGTLPWQNVEKKSDTRLEMSQKIVDKKKSTPISELLQTKNGILPEQFGILLSYTRSLEFKEKPDYDYCKSLLIQVLSDRGFNTDPVFDWPQAEAPVAAKRTGLLPCRNKKN